MLTIKEIRDKNEGQLRSELGERQKHLFDLRSQAVTEKLEDPSQLRKTRKDIARIKTVARQRELEASPKPARPDRKAVAAKAARAAAAKPRPPRKKPLHSKRDKAKKEPATA